MTIISDSIISIISPVEFFFSLQRINDNSSNCESNKATCTCTWETYNMERISINSGEDFINCISVVYPFLSTWQNFKLKVEFRSIVAILFCKDFLTILGIANTYWNLNISISYSFISMFSKVLINLGKVKLFERGKIGQVISRMWFSSERKWQFEIGGKLRQVCQRDVDTPNFEFWTVYQTATINVRWVMRFPFPS